MELSRPVVVQRYGHLTLTLDFQGQILKMLYLMNRAGVKYVLSNTNTNTFFAGVSNTNTNTNTPAEIWSNTNTAHQIQIQIQIHTEAETKLQSFYRWHIQIHCICKKIVLFIQISLKIDLKVPIYNKPALVQIMAWR